MDNQQNGDSRNLRTPLKRYSITTLLVAVRLCQFSDTDKAGVMTSLPVGAIVETLGPSNLGNGMIDVAWQHHCYAVFERDLAVRATLVRIKVVGE